MQEYGKQYINNLDLIALKLWIIFTNCLNTYSAKLGFKVKLFTIVKHRCQ